ncbi:SusC/RagA family TonB-linked outer membrane protein [Sinomicrobium sp. FJxs]|uniref:SusC/RagA family TonB-linked outer membrane protein n=2 Tax=Sinomicrobium weinanense TaxID=2842200 RepID=A0A926JSU0_9FLAO|nr:SusC/RagA family TonB-linked outer membrane protein [Sinomicrobium weinanense]MBU3125216.1 SusC/RagA family TonB-linked outer membrane protein [Sinomicrobium weinanense]
MCKRKTIYVLSAFFFYCQFMLAQQKTVTGVVTDADDGMPLPGVNIVIKGTTKGVSSDFDGNYSIEAPEDAVLVFSNLGYASREVPVAGQSTITITLSADAQELEGVVVTALGIKRETKRLGYAMTEVKGDELAKTNTVNPVQALQGKAPGVSIGSSDGGLFGNSKIQIRGVSALNSNNNQPIFVVDGVILDNNVSDSSADWEGNPNDYGNMLKNLNPDDYESISILKGAAATALYGSRGLNGVVLIKTKDGSGTRGLGVSVKQSVGIDHVYRQPDIQYEYGVGTRAGAVSYGERDANGNYYRFSNNQFYTNDDGIPTLIEHPSSLGYGPKYDGRPIIGYDGEMTTYSPAKDNLLDAYDTGWNTNTSVSLSGGHDKGNFFLSLSHNDRSGTLPNNSFKRDALLFSGAYQLADWLRADASISYTTSKSKNARNDLSQFFINGTYANGYNPSKYRQRQFWQASHGGIPNSDYSDKYAYVPGKSIWFEYSMNNAGSEEQVTRPIVRLTADVAEWLSITAEGNMNYYTTKYERKDWGSGFLNDGGEYQMRHNTDKSYTGKLTANFQKDLTPDITAQLLVGGELWKQEKSETDVRTDGGLIVPGQFFLENSKRNLISSGKVYGTKQISSLYFLSSFGYKDQVFLDITGRNDWSSSLVYTNGEGNYSYFYPSVSSSWLFTQTFNTPDWFTFGKLRASWAQVGSDTDPYAINKGYGIGRYQMDGDKFIYTNDITTTLVDKNIKPERKNSYEIGMDIRFFNNRLGVDFAYYNEIIKNQIGEIPFPQESGYNNYFTNIGTLSNYGVELSVTGTPVKTKNFTWNTTFNYWKNTTKIKDLHEDYGEYKALGGDVAYGNFRIGSVAFKGGEYGVLMSDSSPKKWQSDNPDDPRNGMNVLKWVDSDRGAFYERSYEPERVGKVQPDFEGSLNNSFTYKGISLSVLLDARFGGHIASYSNRYGTSYGWLETSLRGRSPEHGGMTWTSQYSDSQGQQFNDGVIPNGVFAEGQTVTAPNGSTVDVGGLTYQEAMDNGYVEPTHASYFNYYTNSWSDGVVNDDWFSEVKYIALRNISLGYNFPKSVSDKLGAKNFYVSFNARNLGYLYNSLPNNLNPESFRGTSSSDSFRERGFIPYTASYTMTIAIDF